MTQDKRNNFDLSKIRKGCKIIWNDRNETGTVVSKMLPFSDHPDEDMQRETLLTVKTERDAEYTLRQSIKSGDTVKRVGSTSSPDHLKYVEVVK